jgi:alkylation response protein AidB-like acyl-CoA dehydrogenase
MAAPHIVMAVDLKAARLMTYPAALRLGTGHPQAARSVVMAKYHTALAAGRIVDAAVQIFGGSGYLGNRRWPGTTATSASCASAAGG